MTLSTIVNDFKDGQNRDFKDDNTYEANKSQVDDFADHNIVDRQRA